MEAEAVPLSTVNDGLDMTKMKLVSPLAISIMDKTVGRYQSIQNDSRLVHDFLHACTEELQSLLVAFYESVIAKERARMTELLDFGGRERAGDLRRKVSSNESRGADSQNDLPTGVNANKQRLLPQNCYSEHSADTNGFTGEDTGLDEGQNVNRLINRLDTLQAELDVSRSNENFLRSISTEVIKDLEAKDLVIATLQGSLKRRDAVINEQRTAYIYELLHLREMLRQYREKGRCDLADATLYAWDTNAVQRFQEEEMRSKIDAAVMEARRCAQVERDALEAHFKKQMDDLRRKIAAMSENLGSSNSQRAQANECHNAESGSLGNLASQPKDPLPLDLHLISNDFNSSFLGGDSMIMHPETEQEVNTAPFWSGVSGSPSISQGISSRDRNLEHPTGIESPLNVSNFLPENGARRPTQPLPPPTHTHGASDASSKVSVSPIGTKALSINMGGDKAGQRDKNSTPLILASQEAQRACEKQKTNAEPAGLENALASWDERIVCRDRLIERLKLIIKTGLTMDAAQQQEFALVEESEATMRRKEALQEIVPKSPDHEGGSVQRSLPSPKQRSPTQRAEQKKLPNGGAQSSDNDNTVAFGLTTKPRKASSPLRRQEESIGDPNSASELQREVFTLKGQLARLSSGYEDLCLKSKMWFDFYKTHSTQAARDSDRFAAERKLRTAVTVAEAAEERYRVHRWKTIREAMSYKICLQNQRRELKESEASASHRTQQELRNHLEILERTLSRKLLWLRHTQGNLRDEANEAWDLVLIHAKAIARCLDHEGHEEDALVPNKGYTHATLSSAKRNAMEDGRAGVADVTERQIEMHKVASERRKQFNALAQQRLIEKYAVANVVKRYLNSSTASQIAKKDENTAALYPRAPSVLSWSSRPSSAVNRSKIPDDTRPPTENDLVSEIGKPPITESRVVDNVDAQLDPRCFRTAESESERRDRVRSQMLKRSLKGVGVVEKLIQKRIDAAELDESSVCSTGTVLQGKGYSETNAISRQSGAGDSMASCDIEEPLPAENRRPASSMSCNRSSSRAQSNRPMSALSGSTKQFPILTTSTIVPRPASAQLSRGFRCSSALSDSNNTRAPSDARLNASEFRKLAPSQKREQLLKMMSHDRKLKEASDQEHIASVYAMRAVAVAERGGSGNMIGHVGAHIGQRGISRHAKRQANFVHSKGRNTGAPEAEPFALAPIGTLTTEEEMKAGIYRSKLFGLGERVP